MQRCNIKLTAVSLLDSLPAHLALYIDLGDLLRLIYISIYSRYLDFVCGFRVNGVPRINYYSSLQANAIGVSLYHSQEFTAENHY